MKKIRFSEIGQMAEIVVARLAQFPIDGIEELEHAVEIYASDQLMDDPEFKEELNFLHEQMKANFSVSDLKEENWNAQWEASYHPVIIEDKIRIRASFHEPDDRYPYQLLVDPKMAFGTGHHPTTSLMMARMLQLDFDDKWVLDMGSGTGILGILAAKLGARHIDAIDIDAWSFENAQQNAKLNGIDNLQPIKGTADDIPDQQYDVILANINREIIVEQMSQYVAHLAEGGILLTSGYLTADEPRLLNAAEQHGLQVTSMQKDVNWLSMEFKPKNE